MLGTKVSLICTLKNEESSIKGFLDSLLSQSRFPDEIIIVDGGSTDRTPEVIRSYIAKGSQIKLIIREGVNIAEGRNIAIENARYDLIAAADAGCRVDKNWLENLIKPFEEEQKIDVVSGWYEAEAVSNFEKSAAEITYPKLEDILKNPDEFLPSSRSVAFKKSAWKKVGGYPERLTFAGEDTLFDLNLKKAGFKFAFAPQAVVYWKVRPNLRSLCKQYYLYARGDGEAGVFFKRYLSLLLKKYTAGWLLLGAGFKYRFLWVLLAGGIILFVLRTLVRFPKRPFRALMLVPLIEISQICGWTAGVRFKRKKWLRNQFEPKNKAEKAV